MSDSYDAPVSIRETGHAGSCLDLPQGIIIAPFVVTYRVVLILFGIIILLSGSCACPAQAQTQPQASARRETGKVLLLYSYGDGIPAYEQATRAFLSIMKEGRVSVNNLFFEYLDLERKKDTEHYKNLTTLLHHKYANEKIDLIVTVHTPALRFLLNEGKDLSPETPALSYLAPDTIETAGIGRRFMLLPMRMDFSGTLELAQTLFPQTIRVVFVNGIGEGEKRLEREAKSIFVKWHDKLEFEYTSHLSVEEMLHRIATLSPRTIVIYSNVFTDKTGRTFVAKDVAERVAKAANAPVFGMYNTILGSGIIGGSVLSFEAEGSRAGTVALDILRGKLPLAKPVTILTGSKTPMFDWHQLKRWGVSEVKLPKESIFVNRSPSFWEQYKRYVIGVVVFMLAQSILIILLLLQIRRRKKAEEELKEYSERLEEKVQQRTADLTKSNEQLHSEISERMEAEAALRASEERYHSLFIGMTEGFSLHEIICDEKEEPCDYRFLEINPAFERLTGLKREDVVGKTMSQVLPNDDPKWIKIYGEVALTGKSIHFDNYSPVLKRHFEVFAYCPAPRQFGVLFMDITERKEAEEAQQKSQQLFSTLFRVNPGATILSSLSDGKCVDANEAYAKLVGYTRKELIGKTTVELNIWISAAERQSVVTELAQKGHLENVELTLRRKNGEAINTMASGEVITLDGQRYILSIFFDITERKRAEESLRQSEERFKLSMEATHDGLWDWDIKTDEAYFSPAYFRMLGYELSAFPGKGASWKELIHPDDREHALQANLDCIDGCCEHFEVEFRMKAKNGEWRWILGRGKCVARDELGRALRLVGTHADITDRKWAEEDLRRSRDELEMRVQERTAELEKANKTLQELSSRLLSAHEEERKRIAGELHDTIGSCLSGIKFKVENTLQQIGKTTNVGMESLSTIIPVIQEGIEECRRMQMDLRPSLLDDLGLLPTLSWFCRRYQTIYTEIKVELEQTLEERDIPNSLKIVIYRVTQEGMNNIAKHSKADLVCLSLRKMDGRIELVLKDNGQGFDLKEVLGSENTKRGLGLTSMRERTELSGGSFAIQSAQGQGTVIRAFWPLGGND